MLKIPGNIKAQSIIELAILGSVLIMAFGIVISASESYNRQQSYMQQTFRSTLYKAQDTNDASSVSTVDFRRGSNVSNPVEIGSLQQYSSGNSVYWSDGKKDKYGNYPESKIYFLHNRGGYTLIDTGPPGVIPGSTTLFGSAYKSLGLDSKNVYIKDEYAASGAIHTQKDLSATDTVAGTAYAAGIAVGTGGDLYEGGRYGGADDATKYPLHRTPKDVNE
jgi:membrane-bound inhibitor of C-type lysozyme